MLTGAGGNIGVSVGEAGVLMIDTQFAQLMEKIKGAIAKINGGPVRIVINTHGHYDHVSGNEPLARSGAVIVAQERTREWMAKEQSFPEFNQKFPAYPEVALPMVTFQDSLTLYFNGDEIQLLHIEKAHSDADIVVHFLKADVIQTGDLVFSGMYPFIDISHGGSVNGMIAAADEIIKMCGENTKVIPGHGPLTDRQGVKKFQELLVKVKDRIAGHIKAGKSLEEVLASKPTADLDEEWGKAIPAELFVSIVYNDLSRKPKK
jgi:glyoxylase-like metal-dependent hydrolase (beta-lactamase superfamily II)